MKPVRISVLMLDGESDFALFVARCLGRAPGVKLHVLADSIWAPVRFSRHRHYYQTCRTGTDEARLDTIRQVAATVSADVLLPVDDPAIEFASRHQLALNRIAPLVPIPDTKTFSAVTNKWLLADFLQHHHLPTPDTLKYTGDDQFLAQLAKFSFPVLLKPVLGRGGEGIQKFNTFADLVNFLGQPPLQPCSYLIQSYINGYDVDCSVLCRDGQILAYTIQRGFIRGMHRFAAPAGINFIEHDQVLAVTTRLVQETNYNGVAHIDMRYDNQAQQPKIIEVNARYWGSLMGSFMVGVNFPYLACLTALQIEFPRPTYQLARYIAPGSATLHELQRLSRFQKPELAFSETGWKYVLVDPLAETVKEIKKII